MTAKNGNNMHLKKKREFGSGFVLIFRLTPKALSGPILVPFIILSDPRKEKQKLFSLGRFKGGDEKAKGTERGEKRRKRQLVATAPD